MRLLHSAAALLLLLDVSSGKESDFLNVLFSLAKRALGTLKQEKELALASLNNILLIIGISGRVLANSAREEYASFRQDEAIAVAVDVEIMRREKCRVLQTVGSALAEALDAWAAAELQAVAVIQREVEWCDALGNASPWCRNVHSFDHAAYSAATATFQRSLAAVQLVWKLLQCESRPGLDMASALAFCQTFPGAQARQAQLCVESAYWFQLPSNHAEFCHLFCDITAASTKREWPTWQCMHHECLPVVRSVEPQRFQGELFERLVVEMEHDHASFDAAKASAADLWEPVYRRQLPLDVLQAAVQAEILEGGDLLGEISADLERGVYLGALDADVQPEILIGGVVSPLFSALGWSTAEFVANGAIWAGTTRMAISGYQINMKRLKQRKGVRADARALKSLKTEAEDSITHGMCSILDAVHRMNMAALAPISSKAPLQVKSMMEAMGSQAEAIVDEDGILAARGRLRQVSEDCRCRKKREGSGLEPVVEVKLLYTKTRPWLHSYHAGLANSGFGSVGVVAKSRTGRPLVSLWARRGSGGGELPLSRLVVTRARKPAATRGNLWALEVDAESAFTKAAEAKEGSNGTFIDQAQLTDMLRLGTLMRSPFCYNSVAQSLRFDFTEESEAEGCRTVFASFDADSDGTLNWEEFRRAFWQLSVVKLADRTTWDILGPGPAELSAASIVEEAGAGGQNPKGLYRLFQWDVWAMYDESAPVLELYAEEEEAVAMTNASWTSLHHHFCPFYGAGSDTSVESAKASCHVYLGDYKTSLWYSNHRYHSPAVAEHGEGVPNLFDGELSRKTFDAFRKLRLQDDPFAHGVGMG